MSSIKASLAVILVLLLGLPAQAVADDRTPVPRPGEVDPQGRTTDAGGSAADDKLLEPSDEEIDARLLPQLKPGETGEWRAMPEGQQREQGAPPSVLSSRSVNEPPPGGGSIPWSGWAACGVGDSRYQVVRDYARDALHPRMERTYARLYCGRVDTVPNVESKFGFRHIKDRHMGEWEAKAAAMGRGWRDLVGWMMSWMTYDPDLVSVPSGKRFCYQRKFHFVVNGEVVLNTRAVMILGETGVRIMTFFPNSPKGRGYCANKGEVILPSA